MRIVADTNIVVSGLLWQGAPRQLLDLARTRAVELWTSPSLLVELEEVLLRGKFTRRLHAVGALPETLVLGYAALARVIHPPPIGQVIAADPDDDEVLACAVAAQAEAVASGDRHLLELGEYRMIPILTIGRILARLREPRP